MDGVQMQMGGLYDGGEGTEGWEGVDEEKKALALLDLKMAIHSHTHGERDMETVELKEMGDRKRRFWGRPGNGLLAGLLVLVLIVVGVLYRGYSGDENSPTLSSYLWGAGPEQAFMAGEARVNGDQYLLGVGRADITGYEHYHIAEDIILKAA
jgi:hypothetical protein